MIEINKKNARTWSRIGVRASYGMALLEAAKEDTSVLAMSADLGRSSGLNQFISKFPDQFVNAGIAEQNMIGVAAGMAREGFSVFASSFAPFISMRASEQVRMNLGYMNIPVKLVALGSGLSMGFLGNSHYGLEDAAVMRAIPGLTVVSPADCAEVFKVIRASINYPHPVYIRLTGGVNNPMVYQDDYEFEFGKAVCVKEGSDLCIVATGSMVAIAITVANEIEALKGMSVKVVNMHTLKPLDEKCLSELFCESPTIVSLEEHSVVGGLGSAISEFKSRENYLARHISIGIEDCYVKAGDYQYALAEAGLTKDKIISNILSKLCGPS
ncbi:MAG: transketolase [Pseudomonadales bacterium]|nr:transketolase [Pseudomonadales bacterium]